MKDGNNKSKLSKMSMPSKKKPLDDMLVMELEMEPADESDMDMDSEEADVSNELDGEAEGETDGPLADASDEDLLAEMRKRGLSEKAKKASSDEPMSDDEY